MGVFVSVGNRKLTGKFSVLCTVVALFAVAALDAPAQLPTASFQADGHRPPPPGTLIEAYIYAFRAYTGDDARAAQQEARGESGAQLRRALQTQLKLSAEQFALFERSALDYDQASRAIQDRIAAVAVADRALYPAQRSLSAAARARIHALFAELLSGQNVAVGSIHRVLDAADAAKMDDAVLALLVEARASGTRRWNHRLARRGGLLGVANTSNLLDLQEAAGTAPLDNPGGDNLCPALTMVEEDEADEACDDDGGLYDLETCDCSIPGGDGGGGGGGAVPDVTVIAWVNASAVALPSGENAALQAYLQNGTLTAIYPQSSAAAFIAQNDTYQLTPSQIP